MKTRNLSAKDTWHKRSGGSFLHTRVAENCPGQSVPAREKNTRTGKPNTSHKKE